MARSMALSADDRRLATTHEDHTVKLWDVDGGLLRTLRGHGDVVLGVAFAPDGRSFATAGADGTVKVWPAR